MDVTFDKCRLGSYVVGMFVFIGVIYGSFADGCIALGIAFKVEEFGPTADAITEGC